MRAYRPAWLLLPLCRSAATPLRRYRRCRRRPASVSAPVRPRAVALCMWLHFAPVLRRVCRATIMNGARIGRGCIVGAGAIVLEHFQAPPYSLVVGSPATVKREYTDKAACLARAAKQAHQYCARAAAYRRSLREMLDQPEGAECRQWEPAAWEEAAARLGYPRLLGDDGAAGGGGAAAVATAGVAGAEPAADAGLAVGTAVVPREQREGEGGGDGEGGGSPVAPRGGGWLGNGGGGVGSIVVAAAAGAVASVALTALRRVRT